MLFEIGFLTVGWTDLLDILIVSYLFYRLYLIMRGTIAIQIFVGLVVIVALSFLSRALNLQAMSWILNTLTDIWVIAFIILFQPELRRLFIVLGRNRLVARIFRYQIYETIDEICEACEELAEKHTGALIVLARTTGIRMVIETGIPLQAVVSKQLLLSIFNPKAPMHDGAVVINGRFIEAARCTLPLTEQLRQDNFVMGMRHRSAVGITEEADALAVVVSEETGTISLADDGKLVRHLSPDQLRTLLSQKLHTNTKGAFATIVKNQNLDEDFVEGENS